MVRGRWALLLASCVRAARSRTSCERQHACPVSRGDVPASESLCGPARSRVGAIPRVPDKPALRVADMGFNGECRGFNGWPRSHTQQGVSDHEHSHAHNSSQAAAWATHLPVPSRRAHTLLGHELQARRLQSQPWSPGMWRRRCARVCGIRTALATMVTSVGGM